MKCPKCNAEYSEGDVFCTGCGYRFETIGANDASEGPTFDQPGAASPIESRPEVPEVKKEPSAEISLEGPSIVDEPEIELSRELLCYLATDIVFTGLSPLMSPQFHLEEESLYTGKLPDKTLIGSITHPDRAFYFTEFTGRSGQQILLMKDHQFYHWNDSGERISLKKIGGPGTFIEKITGSLKRNIKHSESKAMVISGIENKLLKVIVEIDSGMQKIGVSESFIIQSELNSYIDEHHSLAASLDSLGTKGLIKLLGSTGDNRIIVITESGRELVQVMGHSGYYCHIMVLTAGKDGFSSFHLAGTDLGLYLIEAGKNTEATLVRSLDTKTLRSILEWAWIKDLNL
jgi:hypothetical protein